MSQKHSHSITEAILNMAASTVITAVVLALFGLSTVQNIEITLILTILLFLKTYGIRRYYNKLHMKHIEVSKETRKVKSKKAKAWDEKVQHLEDILRNESKS